MKFKVTVKKKGGPQLVATGYSSRAAAAADAGILKKVTHGTVKVAPVAAKRHNPTIVGVVKGNPKTPSWLKRNPGTAWAPAKEAVDAARTVAESGNMVATRRAVAHAEKVIVGTTRSKAETRMLRSLLPKVSASESAVEQAIKVLAKAHGVKVNPTIIGVVKNPKTPSWLKRRR
jgi:hypothetical protein